MEASEVLLLMRMFERLLGLLAGGLSIVLGYRLFINLPEKTDSSGKVVLPGGVNIWLSRVGPGLFFALFGAAIIAYSFTSTVKVTTEQAAPAAKVSGGANEALVSSRREIAAMSGRSEDAAAKDVRERQIVVLRGVLADLNAVIVRLQREAPPDRDRLVGGVQSAKLLLLLGAWDSSWGDPARFRTWINTGAALPAPAGMDVPAGLYLAGST